MQIKTRICLVVWLSLMVGLLPLSGFSKGNDVPASPGFIKNVGQVTDENRHPRNDIDFKISSADLSVFISSGHLQYQWHKVRSKVKDINKDPIEAYLQNREKPVGDTAELCAMWMSLSGAKTGIIPEAEEVQLYYENYYLPYCYNKIAHCYNRVIYRDIYPNIDWVLYIDKNNANGFKYDFVVHAGGKVSDIQMQYKGATTLSLQEGAINITTRLGSISEEKPFTYDIETGNSVSSNYVLSDSIVSFNCTRADNIVIDPKLNWGSYFTNPNRNHGLCTAADTFGNSYICGYTALVTNTASSNAYHFWYLGGLSDGFIAQFNNLGTRVNWATYYGGENTDQIFAAVTDRTGNLYVAGVTYSYDSISSGGAQQLANGAATFIYPSSDEDGFLTKFDKTGKQVWGTFVGGHGADQATALICDASDNVYVCGVTTGTDSLASAGAFQTTASGQGCGFLASYSAITGKRNWGSFFNGQVYGIAYANNNIVYIDGYTKLPHNIATPGAYQQNFSGAIIDGFVSGFNAKTGAQKWGTYYPAYLLSAVCDSLYNVYVGGGAFSKFDSSGNFKWRKGGLPMALTPDNKILLGGSGPPNNYLSICTRDGEMLYNIGYGDYDGTVCYGSTGDSGRIYIGGTTVSSSGIATTGSYQFNKTNTNDTDYVGYIAQFQADTNVYIKFPYTDTALCIGGPLTLHYGVTNPFRAGNVFTVQLSDVNGSFAAGVNIGNLAYYDRWDIACMIPANTLPGTSYRVRILSSSPADTFDNYDVPIRISKYHQPEGFAPQPICANLNVTMIDTSSDPVPSDTKYTWLSPNAARLPGLFPANLITNLTLADSGNYVVIAENHGCIKKDTFHLHVTVAPYEPIILGDTSLCIGDTLQLTATSPISGVIFFWFNPLDSFLYSQPDVMIPNVAFSDAGKYRVAAVLDGCQSSVQFGQIITVHPLPQPTANNNTPICPGDTLKLTASDTIANVKYSWSGPQGFVSTAKDTNIMYVTANCAGQYIVTSTTTHGCVNTASTTAIVTQAPDDVEAQSNSPVCTGKDLQLTAGNPTPGATYTWTGPNNYTSGQQNPAINNSSFGLQGVYKVVADLNGCKKEDTVRVVVAQSPDTPQLRSNCPLITGDVLKLEVLNIQTGLSYSWIGPNAFLSQQPNPVVNSVIPAMSGVYRLTAMNGKCFAQDSIIVTIANANGDPDAAVIIFPNPNDGSFKIVGQTTTNTPVEMVVFASDGKEVYKATITPVNNKINETVSIGAVANGVYRLKVRIDGKSTTMSFTVKQ